MKKVENDKTDILSEDELDKVNGGVKLPVTQCRSCGTHSGVLYNGYCKECQKKRTGQGKKII